MKSPCWVAAGLMLASVAFAADEGEGKGKKAGKATATIAGKQVCAHCEFGVGAACCPGIKLGDSVVVIEGKAGEELFDSRHGGKETAVTGVLSAKDGHLYLSGKKASEPRKKQKSGVVLRGPLTKNGDALMIANVEVKPREGASLDDLVGKTVRAMGELSVDKENKITLASATATEFTPKKKK